MLVSRSSPMLVNHESHCHLEGAAPLAGLQAAIQLCEPRTLCPSHAASAAASCNPLPCFRAGFMSPLLSYHLTINVSGVSTGISAATHRNGPSRMWGAECRRLL